MAAFCATSLTLKGGLITFSALIIFFTLIGFPEPAFKVLLYTFSFSMHLMTKSIKSSIYKKSLVCLPSEHGNFSFLKQLIIVFRMIVSDLISSFLVFLEFF